MGNIGSQATHISQRQAEVEQQWANSYPRSPPPRLYQHKVLPERDSRQKLRPTNNGEILHSGGTISGRQHRPAVIEDDYNYDDCQEERSKSPATRSYLSNQREAFFKQSGRRMYDHEQRNYYNKVHHQQFKEQVKRFGSEPDLRDPSFQETKDIREKWRVKKKYKAPAPPNSRNSHFADWEDPEIASASPIRRARLYKTRAEMKKKNSSPLDRNLELNRQLSEPNENKYKISDAVRLREHEKSLDNKFNRLSMPEMRRAQSMPEFQQELKEATQRLRNSKLFDRENQQQKKEKLKTLDHNITNKEDIRSKMKAEFDGEEKKAKFHEVRTPGAGQEFKKEKEPPSKTFYFGMDTPSAVNNNAKREHFHNKDVTDDFVPTIPQNKCFAPVQHSSDSDISSELGMDECALNTNGIALQLRPILPKKQLEIPRFSPAAAWRLLSSVESNTAPSTVASDDVPVFIEERIEKLSRPPPPPTIQIGPRSSHDKSGDSGISGDAGPAGFDDSPDGALAPRGNLQDVRVKQRGMSWTPQQDLGDDSSTEGAASDTYRHVTTKFPSKAHVFSLSLPRENHLETYMGDKVSLQTYTGLQKLKRSVSGVLNNLSNKRDNPQGGPNQNQSDNWFLSRSAPNSLNNGFSSLELPPSHKSDYPENSCSLVPTAQKQKHGRLMYLPVSDNKSHNTPATCKISASRSCENICEMKTPSEPEDMQEPPKIEEERWAVRKPKKFTFQSTVRQIERKRLAEKLSREAERKEKQRLQELEAMQRVEEEFQRKRAREKASIRQQLRLFSMEDSGWSSLPPNLDKDNHIAVRPEPDGAVSSATSTPSLPQDKTTNGVFKQRKKSSVSKYTTSSESSEENRVKAPVTQVLSEYRQPQREYKDYRGSARYLGNGDHHEPYIRQTVTTIHPQITCNMPKVKGHSGSPKDGGLNYRKNFARGVKSNKSTGSTYSEESNRNNSPGEYYHAYGPVTRF